MQMEGCIMMGLSYTLSEEVRFKGAETSGRILTVMKFLTFLDSRKLKQYW